MAEQQATKKGSGDEAETSGMTGELTTFWNVKEGHEIGTLHDKRWDDDCRCEACQLRNNSLLVPAITLHCLRTRISPPRI
jgi:hypothetical protein